MTTSADGLFISGGTMRYGTVIRAALVLGLATAVGVLAVAYRPVNAAAALTPGKAELKSAGALAFGPDGVLFVGDSIGGTVVALDTERSHGGTQREDRRPGHRPEDRGAGRRDAGPDHDQRHRGEPDLEERLRLGLARPRSGRAAARRARRAVGHGDAAHARQHRARVGQPRRCAGVGSRGAPATRGRRPSPIWRS